VDSVASRYRAGQQVELCARLGPFGRGQIVEIRAAWQLPSTAELIYVLGAAGEQTVAGTGVFGARQLELPNLEVKTMHPQNEGVAADGDARLSIKSFSAALPVLQGAGYQVVQSSQPKCWDVTGPNGGVNTLNKGDVIKLAREVAAQATPAPADLPANPAPAATAKPAAVALPTEETSTADGPIVSAAARGATLGRIQAPAWPVEGAPLTAKASDFALGQLADIPLDLIDPDPDNEREITPASLTELQLSIAEHGQTDPIQVYRQPDNDRFMNRTGHRRCEALRLLGRQTVRAIPEPPTGDEVQRILNRILSNHHQEKLDPIRLARSLKGLLATQRITQEELGKRFGHDQSWIANLCRLLELPLQVQELVSRRQISPGHCIYLLRITQPELDWSGRETATATQAQIRFAEQTARDGDGVRTLEYRVQSYLQQQASYQRTKVHLAEEAKRKAAEQQHLEEVKRTAATAGKTVRQAVADDKTAQAAEEARRVQEAKTREQARRDARKQCVNELLDQALGYAPETPPSLELLRLATIILLDGADLADKLEHEITTSIEAATDLFTLLRLMGRIARNALRPDNYELRTVDGPYKVKRWAEQRYYLNAAIADALIAEKLIMGRTYTTLMSEATRRPQGLTLEAQRAEAPWKVPLTPTQVDELRYRLEEDPDQQQVELGPLVGAGVAANQRPWAHLESPDLTGLTGHARPRAITPGTAAPASTAPIPTAETASAGERADDQTEGAPPPFTDLTTSASATAGDQAAEQTDEMPLAS